MSTIAKRVARRFLARFKAPRKGFPADLEPIAAKWTAEIERHGHDLGDWKGRSDDYHAKCVRCDMQFRLTPLVSYGVFHQGAWSLSTQLPTIYDDDDWKAHQCVVEVRNFARGLLIVPSRLGGLETYTDEKLVEAALLKWMKGGVGSHWTDQGNESTYRRFAMGLYQKEGFGLPVVLHADFRREDQRRNYKENPHWQLVEFTDENETQLGANEIVRLTGIEWFDGAKWVRRKLPDIKVKTGRV